MPTYTCLTDFRGGTYICQKMADDLRAACHLWKEDVASGGYIPKLDVEAFSSAFQSDIDELPPVALDTVKNVWLFDLLIGRDMLSLHVIQTDTSTVEAELRPTPVPMGEVFAPGCPLGGRRIPERGRKFTES